MKRLFNCLLVVVLFSGFCFINSGYNEYVPTPTVALSREIIPAVADETNLDLDLNTLCSNANQFGINYINTMFFTDESAISNHVYYEVDNTANRGYVHILRPNSNVEMYFDDFNKTGYTRVYNSTVSSDWTIIPYELCTDVYTTYLNNCSDYSYYLDSVSNVINIVKDNCLFHQAEDFGDWYIANVSDTDLLCTPSVPASIDSVEARVYIPKDFDKYIVQVDYIVNYTENEFNIHREVIEYDIELNVPYNCDISYEAQALSTNYDKFVEIYETVMR